MADDPNVDPATDPQDPPADPNPEADPADPADPPADDPKAKAREGYEVRKLRERLEAMEKENRGYRTRAEEERKAKLTEEQRLKEERDQLARDNERLTRENLQAKIASEFKLPALFADRISGTDEESMRADAEAMAKHLARTKAGTTTDPAKGGGQQRLYKRSELARDPVLAASPEVRQAALEGRVIQG